MEIRDALYQIIKDSSRSQASWARDADMKPQVLNDYLRGRKDLVGDRIQRLLWQMDAAERDRFSRMIASNGDGSK